jgi:coproporphyrinogen III oxidase-like Fe-S oxidoreductase
MAGEDPVGAAEHVDAAARAAERLELALRTRDGVLLADVPDGVALGVVVDAGLVEADGERLRLTRAGRLLATEVTLRLMA